MAEAEADQLKDAVEHMHSGRATLAQSVPVRETFESKPVWEGVVHVFGLVGPYIYLRLCLIIAYRGEHQAPVLRCVA